MPLQVVGMSNFANKYQLREELGRGAFGIVRRCIHLFSGKEYAVKIINTRQMRTKELEHMKEEARICRMLKHPNIVQLHDSIEESRTYYMVFDLVVGGELFEDIVRRENYTEAVASECLYRILDAIAYCHRRRVIHRDLKPENLLLTSRTRNAQVKVADFGLAVAVPDDKPRWYGYAGTPGYMAPEMLKQNYYDNKIDVWACGVILYLLLAGYPPFHDRNERRMDEKVMDGRFGYPEREWRYTSNEAKDIINRMLEVDPARRITAEEALQHPWLSNREQVTNKTHLAETVVQLKKFNASRKLKGAVYTAMVAMTNFKTSPERSPAPSARPFSGSRPESLTDLSNTEKSNPQPINDQHHSFNTSKSFHNTSSDQNHNQKSWDDNHSDGTAKSLTNISSGHSINRTSTTDLHHSDANTVSLYRGNSKPIRVSGLPRSSSYSNFDHYGSASSISNRIYDRQHVQFDKSQIPSSSSSSEQDIPNVETTEHKMNASAPETFVVNEIETVEENWKPNSRSSPSPEDPPSEPKLIAYRSPEPNIMKAPLDAEHNVTVIDLPKHRHNNHYRVGENRDKSRVIRIVEERVHNVPPSYHRKHYRTHHRSHSDRYYRQSSPRHESWKRSNNEYYVSVASPRRSSKPREPSPIVVVYPSRQKERITYK